MNNGLYYTLFRPTFSVILRDIRIQLRYKSWFVASFIWPLLFPFSFLLFGRAMAGPSDTYVKAFEGLTGTGDYASFLVIGNVLWMFVNINLWTGGLAFQQDRERGTFETHWSMPASMLSQAFGSSIAQSILNFFPMILSIFVYSLFGVLSVNAPIGRIFVAFLMLFPFLIGFLLIFASLTLRTRQSAMIVQVTRTVLSVICGMQFPLAVLPNFLQKAGNLLPLTRLITLIRNVVIEGALFSDFKEDIFYILFWGFVSIALGIGIFLLVQHSVRKKGVTSGY